MRSLARFLAVMSAALLLIGASASAQVISVEQWVEEWDEQSGEWVRVSDGADRLVASVPPRQSQADADKALARFGPFMIIDKTTAGLVGATDLASPRHFKAMLRAYPDITSLRLIEAPGTDDDRGNLQLGRLIRAAGLETHVPRGGSVRSGAVELFLAGATRRIDDGAEFAVHSWLDNYGRQASDFDAGAPAHRVYLDYYREVGMSEPEARAFYDMTNSVPHAEARWLTAQDMRRWIADANAVRDAPAERAEPTAPTRIAYLDLNRPLD